MGTGKSPDDPKWAQHLQIPRVPAHMLLNSCLGAFSLRLSLERTTIYKSLFTISKRTNRFNASKDYWADFVLLLVDVVLYKLGNNLSIRYLLLGRCIGLWRSVPVQDYNIYAIQNNTWERRAVNSIATMTKLRRQQSG